MKNLITTLLLFWILGAFGQDKADDFGKHTMYAELGTYGVIAGISLNYERKFYTNATGKARFYGRLGLAGTTIIYGPGGPGGVAGITLLTGKQNNHFIASGGIFVGRDYNAQFPATYALPMLDIGYRFQRPEGGFLFQAQAGIFGLGIGIGGSF